MEMINKFDLRLIPPYKILFAITSACDWDMSRVILAEHYPDYGLFALISGGHCSCYGFDETEWDAMILTEDELKRILAGWIDNGLDYEQKLATLALPHIL